MRKMTDLSVPDIDWWFSDYAEFEDFVGIGDKRVLALAEELSSASLTFTANRLLKANGLPHGPCNTREIDSYLCEHCGRQYNRGEYDRMYGVCQCGSWPMSTDFTTRREA